MAVPPALRPHGRVLAVVAVLSALSVLVAAVVMREQGPAAPGRGSGVALPPAVAGVAGECAGQPLAAPREMRGLTLTTVYNIDWPSRPGLDEQSVKTEYLGWLDLVQRLHYNAIFVHIRPSGDAFWPSAYAPWSDWLTGKRDGVGPGWDPLAFMITEAHARDIQFHGWFNPYRGGQPAPLGAGGDLYQLAPNHPLRAHPGWAVVYPAGTTGSRLYFDPGIPEARRYVEDSILEAVSHYDLDGVFFDDFFYPYPEAGQSFNDAASFAAYGQGSASLADWRRGNVNTLVQEMHQRIKALKPWVAFGISPFGIWRNDSTDPAGSATKGLQSYDDTFVDSRGWVRNGWVDYIVPQLYWNIGFEKADYAKLLPWWAKVVEGTGVKLYIGQGDYRIGETGVWKDPAELDRQLTLNGRYGVAGSLHYNAKTVRADPLGAVTRYTSAHYATPALPPRLGQPGAGPAAPALSGVRREAAGTTITWRAGAGTPATSFAIYRAAGGPAQLVATVRRAGDGEQHWTDPTGTAAAAYCVTGVDRLGNEGMPSGADHAP